MSRILMATRIRPDRLQDYLTMHSAPDADVAPMLRRFGHDGYRLHLLGEIAIASFDYTGTDLDADRKALRARPELADWMRRTAACQSHLGETLDAPLWSRLPLIFAADTRDTHD
jgi:L-rhamnose mutarotase